MPKIQSESVLRCSADSFYNHIRANMNNIPQHLPETFKSIQVLEGDGMTMGTVRYWKYVVGGNIVHAKDTIEAVDTENRSVTSKVYGGDIPNLYDSLRIKYQITPLGEDECSVQYTVEFVKVHEHVPTPYVYLDLISMVGREMVRQLKY